MNECLNVAGGGAGFPSCISLRLLCITFARFGFCGGRCRRRSLASHLIASNRAQDPCERERAAEATLVSSPAFNLHSSSPPQSAVSPSLSLSGYFEYIFGNEPRTDLRSSECCGGGRAPCGGRAAARTTPFPASLIARFPALLIGAGGTGGTDGTGDPKIPDIQISMLILGQLSRNAPC